MKLPARELHIWAIARRLGPPRRPADQLVSKHVFVFGADPGVSRFGYCIVESAPSAPGTGMTSRDRRRTSSSARAVAMGVLTTSPELPVHLRLAELQRELQSLIREYQPTVLAIERVLFQVNVRTAMAVGQASGIAMAEAANAGCEVVQYSPNQVKEAVAGHGAAGKREVQQMVQVLLGLDTAPEPADVADAAAVALCHVAIAPVLSAVNSVVGPR
ncbi:MAG: crossover junction endodeoxyribonuclease RuvC [Acidimicrobiales bacterium]|nr:crossover junction endodeoxyribonuclease RuvC [Acidimicrobiales bacterium]